MTNYFFILLIRSVLHLNEGKSSLCAYIPNVGNVGAPPSMGVQHDALGRYRLRPWAVCCLMEDQAFSYWPGSSQKSCSSFPWDP